MYEINLRLFGYLFLRLSPFIIASFFTMSSILNSDYKGMIYLAGLVMSSVIVMMFSSALNMIDAYFHTDPTAKWFARPPESATTAICSAFTLIDDIALLPQGQALLTFTFGYLLYPMIWNKLYTSNWPTLIFFPMIILFDFYWNYNNACFSFGQLLASLLTGGFLGYAWASIVSNNGKNKDYLYFTDGSAELVKCSAAANQTFKCRVYKGGTLLTKSG